MGLNDRIESLPPDMQAETVHKSISAVKRLKGLGKEIWQGADPGQYVEDLRRDW